MDENRAERPAGATAASAVVIALVGAVATGLVGVAGGLAWWQLAALIAVTPSVLLVLTCLVVAGLPRHPAPSPTAVLPEPSAEDEPAEPSARRRAALDALALAEQRLVRAVRQDHADVSHPADIEHPAARERLLVIAAAHYRARLRLASVELGENGVLDQDVQDELVATHLGMLASMRVDVDAGPPRV